MGKCSYRSEWLMKEDGQGWKVSEWAHKHSDTEVFCKICVKVINIAKKGFQALEQHASSNKHKKECHIKLEPKQLHLTALSSSSRPASTSTSHVAPMILHSTKDKAIAAEVIWILKCVSSNYAAASVHGIHNTFEAMFPGAVPRGFSLSRTKLNYVLTEALEPYFKEQLCNDLEGAFYTLCYDETSNAAGRKELQISVHYWSNGQHKVVNHHLQTFFVGKATAEEIFCKLKKALDKANLSLHKLLMLGCDGPNVNKKVTRLMNEELSAIRKKKLIDIGSCSVHTLHNAFQKGLSNLGQDASDLIIAIYNFFNGWPSRWEDFNNIQEKVKVPKLHFIKHCPSRWLTLEAAAERVLQQWNAVTYYFLHFIPQNKPSLLKSSNYKLIVTLLKVNTMEAELHFVHSSAKVFVRFTGTFQKDEPLIHLLHNEVKTLVLSLLGRVCKPFSSRRNLEFNDAIFETHNLLPLKEISCGEQVAIALNEVPEIDKLQFLMMARDHYIEACKYVIHKGPLSISLFQHFCCLQPNEIVSKQSICDIVTIAKALPIDIPSDRLIDEWKLLQLEDKSREPSIDSPIDQYWNHFLTMHNASGAIKYPTVGTVVKCSLSLSHGNADIERRFSASGRILTEDRSSMSEWSLNAYLVVKDALRFYKGKPEFVHISKRLIALCQSAHFKYKSYLEDKKRKEEATEREQKEEAQWKKKDEEDLKAMGEERKILEHEDELRKQRKQEAEAHNIAKKLFEEAAVRLHRGLEKKDFEQVQLAQGMLAGFSKLQQEEEVSRKQTQNLEKKIEKRKNSLITSFFNKKPKY